jgi:hypothetical protein
MIMIIWYDNDNSDDNDNGIYPTDGSWTTKDFTYQKW